MDNLEQEKLFKLYTLAEMTYENHFKDFDNIYPEIWYEKDNYKEKIEIISDAIKNNVLIEYTELYKDYLDKGKCLSKE